MVGGENSWVNTVAYCKVYLVNCDINQEPSIVYR